MLKNMTNCPDPGDHQTGFQFRNPPRMLTDTAGIPKLQQLLRKFWFQNHIYTPLYLRIAD